MQLNPENLDHFLRLARNTRNPNSDGNTPLVNRTSLEMTRSNKCRALGLIDVVNAGGYLAYTLTTTGVELAREHGVSL